MTDDAIDAYARIPHSRTSAEIIQQIELLILEGVLRDNERLPSERELSRRFDVSRPILREALKELEARGLLVSHHGGGTFVADVIGQIFSKPVIELIGRHQKATQDYLEYRRELEGMTAEFAARRATRFDKEMLTRIMEEMRAASRGLGRRRAEDQCRAPQRHRRSRPQHRPAAYAEGLLPSIERRHLLQPRGAVCRARSRRQTACPARSHL